MSGITVWVFGTFERMVVKVRSALLFFLFAMLRMMTCVVYLQGHKRRNQTRLRPTSSLDLPQANHEMFGDLPSSVYRCLLPMTNTVFRREKCVRANHEPSPTVSIEWNYRL